MRAASNLLRRLIALEAEVKRLREALAHYATDEEPWGWVAIEALRPTSAKGEEEHD
jgi:hypothetical protein